MKLFIFFTASFITAFFFGTVSDAHELINGILAGAVVAGLMHYTEETTRD